MNVLFQCFGITGIIFIFYSLIAFAVTQGAGLFPWILLGLGFLLIVIFTIGAFQAPSFMKDVFAKKSLRSGTGVVTYSIIAIAVLVVLNVMSSRLFHYEKDVTENFINTLADQSKKSVTSLPSSLEITVFMDERNPKKEELKELLQRYQNESKKVQVHFVDPDKDKITAEQHHAKDGDVLVKFDSQTHVTQNTSEEGITQAILKVARTSSPIVCFTKGHGEMLLDSQEDEPRGLSSVKNGLENEGYQPKDITSVLPNVPEECSVLVVAGPTQLFTVSEAGAVDRFLEKGGKGLFLLDPNIPDPTLVKTELRVLDTGLEAVIEKWGVRVGKNILLEKHLTLFKGMQVDLSVRAQKYADHPIVDLLKEKNTVFDRVRSVQKKEGFSGTSIELIFSAESSSWAQSNVDVLYRKKQVALGKNDIPGPVPIAVASEKDLQENKKVQLVVIGDSDFISNGMIQSFEFNYDLLLNSLSWLSGSQEKISIRPKQLRTSTIELTPEQSSTIFYTAIVGLPMLVLVFGLNLWWYRRRKG